jgi:DMSO/TMAO reductase YedYZ molybdopterin-dependent catalytic subunit
MASRAIYYDAHPIEHMRHHLTMLAYDMNGEPLSYGHGAPLRLRNESEHGFKQVRWLGGIEFVRHFSEPAEVATTKITNSSDTAMPFDLCAARAMSIARSARGGSRLESAYFVVARGRKACPLTPQHGGARSGAPWNPPPIQKWSPR